MARTRARFPDKFDDFVRDRLFSRAILWADPRVQRAFFEALPNGAQISSFFRDYEIRNIARRHGYKVKKNRKTRKFILIKPHFKEHEQDETFMFDPEMLELDEQTETTDTQQ